MEYTDKYTRNGKVFVRVGSNLIRNWKLYPNVQPNTLISLGYKQVIIITIEDDGEEHLDGWTEVGGVTYWAQYVIEPSNEEVEPIIEE